MGCVFWKLFMNIEGLIKLWFSRFLFDTLWLRVVQWRLISVFSSVSLSLSLSLWLSFHYLQRSICPRDPGQKAPRFIDPSNFPWVPVLSPYFSAWSMSSVPNHPAMPGPCPDHAPLQHTIVPLLKSVPWISGISSFLSSQCEKYHKYPLASETSQPSQVWSRWVSSLPKWAKWSWEMPSASARQSPEALVPLGRHQRLIAIWWWPMFIATNNMSILYVYAYIHMHPYWTCSAVISCGK